MSNPTPKVLVVATSRKTRGGITSVIKAHETGEQWKQFHCKWIQTHRDGSAIRKLWYLGTAFIEYLVLLPFYDIVHIHAGLRTSISRKLIFAKLAKTFRKKVIIHFHPATEKHLFNKELNAAIYRLFNYADLLIVLSPQWIKWINKAFPGNSFVFEVLYNPCPQVRRGNIQKKHQILFAGTLIERKGYNRLIDAFAEIANDFPDWKLQFAGNGEIEKAKQIVSQKNIGQQVEFLGWISGKDKDKAFSEASIYCLPSWGEGFSMGVLEAIAYGIPVVTTPVGGISDIIDNGINGYIFETYDTQMLSDDLTELMQSEEKRKMIVAEADKLRKNEFNIGVINQKLGQIYTKIMTNNNLC